MRRYAFFEFLAIGDWDRWLLLSRRRRCGNRQWILIRSSRQPHSDDQKQQARQKSANQVADILSLMRNCYRDGDENASNRTEDDSE
jgi:hypothetical protein